MADNLTTFLCRLSCNLGPSNSWKPQGLSGSVMGLLYLYNFWHLGAIFMEFFLEQRNAIQHADLSVAVCYTDTTHFTIHTLHPD
jgi:hypothetical protein